MLCDLQALKNVLKVVFQEFFCAGYTYKKIYVYQLTNTSKEEKQSEEILK